MGIPELLLYYYGPYWVHPFEELGIEVINAKADGEIISVWGDRCGKWQEQLRRKERASTT